MCQQDRSNLRLPGPWKSTEYGDQTCWIIVFGLAEVSTESVDEEFFCLCGDSSQSRQGETGVATAVHSVLQVEVVHREATIKSMTALYEVESIWRREYFFFIFNLILSGKCFSHLSSPSSLQLDEQKTTPLQRSQGVGQAVSFRQR